MNIALGVAAGIGIGFILGCLFSRLSEKQMFQLVTETSDSLVRSALFPGLSKEAFEPSKEPEPAEEMYETAETIQEKGWLWSDERPWGEEEGE